jgi:hypothetical protein
MWVHLQFNGLPDEMVHVTRFGGEEFCFLKLLILRRRANIQKTIYHYYNMAKA